MPSKEEENVETHPYKTCITEGQKKTHFEGETANRKTQYRGMKKQHREGETPNTKRNREV